MALSDYDKQFLSKKQQQQLLALTEEDDRAVAAGKPEGSPEARAAGAQIRAQAGYSGGADGLGYRYLGRDTSGRTPYQPAQLRAADSQEAYIQALYKAKEAASRQALKTAYDQNVLELQAAQAQLPASYQAARNQAAGAAAVGQANFNEYAAASGLNSGAGGQARLAMQNSLQGKLAAIGLEESQAQRQLENQRLQLNARYRNDVAQAIQSGNLEAASALYQEAMRVDDSLVQTARDQADEDYRAWSAGRSQYDSRQSLYQNMVSAMLRAGVRPGEEMIAASGLDPEYVNAMLPDSGDGSYRSSGGGTRTKTGGGRGTAYLVGKLTLDQQSYDAYVYGLQRMQQLYGDKGAAAFRAAAEGRASQSQMNMVNSALGG